MTAAAGVARASRPPDRLRQLGRRAPPRLVLSLATFHSGPELAAVASLFPRGSVRPGLPTP